MDYDAYMKDGTPVVAPSSKAFCMVLLHKFGHYTCDLNCLSFY